MLCDASVVVVPVTPVQLRVRLIKLVIKFGVVIVGIIPVAPEGRRGGSSGAVARDRVFESPVKSVSCDRKAML